MTVSVPVAQRKNNKLLLILLIAPPVMLLVVFFVLVPLYGLLCAVTGYNLQPNNTKVVLTDTGTSDREISLYIEARVLDNLPLKFSVDVPHQVIRVGKRMTNVFRIENYSDHPVSFRPIHLVSPQHAALSFTMLVCFCFNDQTIEPGGVREFPVVYGQGADLDPRVKEVTVGYTLLAIKVDESVAQSRARVEQAAAGHGTVISPFRSNAPADESAAAPAAPAAPAEIAAEKSPAPAAVDAAAQDPLPKPQATSP